MGRNAWFALLFAIWTLGYGLRWYSRRHSPERPSLLQGLLWMGALTTMAAGFVLDACHVPAWGQALRQDAGRVLVACGVPLAIYEDERKRQAGVPRPAWVSWLDPAGGTRAPIASWGYPLIGAVSLLVGSRIMYNDVPKAVQLAIIALLLVSVPMILFGRKR